MYIKKRFLYMLIVALKTNSLRYERYYSEKKHLSKHIPIPLHCHV